MLNAALTRKIPLILGWLGGFIVQALVRATYDDISLISALLPMTGTAFVLFTNYMITDPGTTPVRPRNQVVFGVTIAAAYGVLVAQHVVFGLFFALIIACALRGVGLVLLGRTATRPAPAARPQPGATPQVAVSTPGQP
jgi:Na+-translocating ferredoxin:NAD+ oxidoreductase RnfD subunit